MFQAIVSKPVPLLASQLRRGEKVFHSISRYFLYHFQGIFSFGSTDVFLPFITIFQRQALPPVSFSLEAAFILPAVLVAELGTC